MGYVTGHLARRERTRKRGGGDGSPLDLDLTLVIDRERAPEDAALMAEEVRLRPDQRGDESLRAAALAKTEGLTNAEPPKTRPRQRKKS